MKIWVDADACPGVIKEILFRVADRAKVDVILVANHSIRIPPSRFITMVTVASGFDVADDEMVERLSAGDLVITADIPLASEVIDKGGVALNPRGELYTEQNIKSILNMRDFMDTMRASGVHTGGPAAMGPGEKQAFGNQLDRFVTKHHLGISHLSGAQRLKD